MSKWFRAWGATALAWALVLVVGGIAMAGAGSGHPSKSSHASVSASESESPEAEASDKPDATESPESTPTAAADNHGACVSHWVHAAQVTDLAGRNFGQFVSTVARSDGTGAGCDFKAALTAAIAAQASATPAPHGRSGESHGKSQQHHQ